MSDINDGKKIERLVGELKKQGFEAICFILPAYNTGGGTYYLCELAKSLSKKDILNVYYMDYPGGYPTKLLQGTNVNVVEYNGDELDFPIKEKCVVVTNSTRVILLQRMRGDNRLLFWHYETIKCAWDSVLIMNEKEDFLELCREKDGMAFHDWSGWDSLNMEVEGEYKKKYLPLYLDAKKGRKCPELVSENEIHITILGRLGNDKIHALYNVLENLARYKTKRKKVIHIIGDGFCKMQVIKRCERYKGRIEVVFAGTVPKEELDECLINNTDILFAMGLSVYEGARLGIPSVAVQLSPTDFFDEDFFWIFHTYDYCAGILPEQKCRFLADYDRFDDILDDIYINGKMREYSERCLSYCDEFSSNIEEATWLLLRYMCDSRLNAEDIERCIKYMPYSHVRVRKMRLLGLNFNHTYME